MKNNQGAIFNFILLFTLVVLSPFSLCAASAERLVQADSLFTGKHYAESFQYYRALLDEGRYSPSMLLKMSFIQEGLDSVASSLYYLNLYYLATGDERVAVHMQKIAQHKGLRGYEQDWTGPLHYVVCRRYGTLLLAALPLIAALLVWFVHRRRRNSSPYGVAALLSVVLLLFVLHAAVNNRVHQVIVSTPYTYVMKGPAAAAPVIQIITPGHRLSVTGHKDVWLRVRWGDSQGYIKRKHLRPIDL